MWIKGFHVLLQQRTPRETKQTYMVIIYTKITSEKFFRLIVKILYLNSREAAI